MKKLGIMLGCAAIMGAAMAAATDNGVELDMDDQRGVKPERPTNHPSAGKKPKQKRYAALPHERPERKEKSAGLKRMLGNKGRA